MQGGVLAASTFLKYQIAKDDPCMPLPMLDLRGIGLRLINGQFER
jgi:hypothetical protein